MVSLQQIVYVWSVSWLYVNLHGYAHHDLGNILVLVLRFHWSQSMAITNYEDLPTKFNSCMEKRCMEKSEIVFYIWDTYCHNDLELTVSSIVENK